MVALILLAFYPVSPQKELRMNLGLKSHGVLTISMGHIKLLSSALSAVLIDWVVKLWVAETRHGVFQPCPVAKASLADPVDCSAGEEHTFLKLLTKDEMLNLVVLPSRGDPVARVGHLKAAMEHSR